MPITSSDKNPENPYVWLSAEARRLQGAESEPVQDKAIEGVTAKIRATAAKALRGVMSIATNLRNI